MAREDLARRREPRAGGTGAGGVQERFWGNQSRGVDGRCQEVAPEASYGVTSCESLLLRSGYNYLSSLFHP